MPIYGDERLPQRIWANIYPEPNTGCWLWGASEARGGYGQVHWQKRTRRIHTVVYEILIGSPGDLDLDHRCRTRLCCNPDHLEPLTRQQNLARGQGLIWMKRRERDACKHGHPFTPENTHHDGKGRVCRTCRRIKNQKYRSRQKEQA
jgi:hypothetical protein